MKGYQYCHMEAISYSTEQFQENYIEVLAEPHL